MNTNECLKNSIDAFRYSRGDGECNINKNPGIEKAMIKIAGLKIKACGVYGKLSPDEVIYNTEKIADALTNVFHQACDGNDLDALLSEISDIGTQILGMADTGISQ